MQSHIFFLIVIGIGLAVTIPYAYSAVEPSIIINMESGQVTKPFQIKDNLGAEVFSVDVDGTVFPSVSAGVTTVESLRHIVIGEDSKTSTFTENVDDQKVLAKWRIDFNSLEDCGGNCGFFGFPPVFVTHFVLSGFMKNDNADFVQTSMSTSFDDITVDNEFQTDGNGSVGFQVTKFDDVNDFDICQRTLITQNQCFITFGYHIPQGTGSTAVIKDYIFELGIILPANTIITKLI